MKDKLHGFYKLAEADFEPLWKEGRVVVDANVLLNIYRYPAQAREDLLKALEALEGRLWVPFHAALEYQRNRLSVIREQKARFKAVHDIVAKVGPELSGNLSKLQLDERHSSIDPSELVKAIDDACSAFIAKLSALDESQPDVHHDDGLRDKLDALLAGKVGEQPEQVDLDRVVAEGEQRFRILMPPGFSDAEKATGDAPSYSYGGRRYEAKYGDLYFWKEVVSFARLNEVSKLILLTDDRKEDWWTVINASGKKHIGPRPELVEEIRREGGVEAFHMYKTDQFLKFAKQYLEANVSEQSIEQIREVGQTEPAALWTSSFRMEAEAAIMRWLRESDPSLAVRSGTHRDYDIITTRPDGKTSGYDVIVSQTEESITPWLKGHMRRKHYKPAVDARWIVMVSNYDLTTADFAAFNSDAEWAKTRVGIIFGRLFASGPNDRTFFPNTIFDPENGRLTVF